MDDVDAEEQWISTSSVGPAGQAQRLFKNGQLSDARKLIEETEWSANPDSAVLYFTILYSIEDYRALHKALADAIDVLQHASEAPVPLLKSLLHRSEQTCLDHSLQVKLQKRCTELAPDNPTLGRAVRAAAARRNFAQNRPKSMRQITFIPLGLNCMPWQSFNRWGFRSEEQFINDYNPFCLAVHRLNGVVSALRTDFRDYAQPDALMNVKSASGRIFVARKDRAACWNHNLGAYWTNENYRALIWSLERRIAQFRQSCRQDVPVFIVGSTHTEYPETQINLLALLNEGLAQYTGTEKNRIIFTNVLPKLRESEYFRVDENTCFFYRPFPSKDYVWHDAEYTHSDIGLDYERAYMQHVITACTDWGLMDKVNNAETALSDGPMPLMASRQ